MENSAPAMPDPEGDTAPPPLLFADDVRAAAEKKQLGKLGLLGLEAQQYPWQAAGLELATNALTRIGGPSAERITQQLSGVMNSENPSSNREDVDPAHAIIFTGHMIDSPNRATPRFPARAEPTARAAIRQSLLALQEAHPGNSVGVAGGASGGDLLFHEVCADLNIDTLLRLTVPPDAFIALSVAPAGTNWVDRFHTLIARLGPDRIQVLGESLDLPEWMSEVQKYDAWQRTNLWLVQEAIGLAPGRSLLALWDGRPGDGPGGTQHLVEAASQYGVSVLPPIRTSTLWDDRSAMDDGRS